MFNGVSEDLSPISIPCLILSPVPKRSYGHSPQIKGKDDFSTLCRIGGLGYRALGRIDYKRSLRRGDLQCGSGPFYPSQYGAHVAVGADLSIHTAEWGPI